ncbi:MAG: type II secretion system protein [Candidatus Riflebacteria bacterium]|nr:type II secretion system protein [Candidatus Riflebacteria bacterium]
MPTSDRRGYSLAELGVVIALLLLLSTSIFVWPERLQTFQDRGRYLVIEQNAVTVTVACRQFHVRYGRYPIALSELARVGLMSHDSQEWLLTHGRDRSGPYLVLLPSRPGVRDVASARSVTTEELRADPGRTEGQVALWE